MRKFATESGKSKGRFYTPAEVSRILAKIVGIDQAKKRDITVYDPACGSLLIRADDKAPFEVTIYGQEKEIVTAGLAKMNLVLHNKKSPPQGAKYLPQGNKEQKQKTAAVITRDGHLHERGKSAPRH